MFQFYRHMDGYDGSGVAMWFWMAFWSVALVGLIIGGIYFLRTPNQRQHADIDPAEAALRLRFARGEISTEEFHNRLLTLASNRN